MRSDLLSLGSSNLIESKGIQQGTFDRQSGVWWAMPARIWRGLAYIVLHACSDKARDKPELLLSPARVSLSRVVRSTSATARFESSSSCEKRKIKLRLDADRLGLAFETGLATISSAGGRPLSVSKILKRALPTSSKLWRAPDDKVGAVEAGEPAGVTLIHAF